MIERNVPMMGCGHAANANDGKGKPVCVICMGILERIQNTIDEVVTE